MAFRYFSYSGTLILFFVFKVLFAQNETPRIKELQTKVAASRSDSEKADLLSKLAYEHFSSSPYKTHELSIQALDMAKKGNLKAIEAAAYFNLGLVNYVWGNLDSALKLHMLCYKIGEELNNPLLQANAYTGFGLVNLDREDLQKSLDNFKKSKSFYEKTDDKKGIGHTHNMMGNVYFRMGEFDKAKEHLIKSLEIAKSIDYKELTVSVLQDLGNLFYRQNKNNLALLYYRQSLEVANLLNSDFHRAYTLNGLGQCLRKENKTNEAIAAFDSSLVYSTRSSLKNLIQEAYLGLSEIYSGKGDYKKAYNFQKLYQTYKDSIFNNESINAITKLSYVLESEKKQQQIALLEKNIQIEKQNSEYKVLQRNLLLIGFLFIASLSFFILNRYRNKKKANFYLAIKNARIENQKEEISKKNKTIELKNKDIFDSLNYARRIQRAMLPEDAEIENAFKDYFVINMPRDIVSGDFYWYSLPEEVHQSNSAIKLLAVGDCTGHGVPGAFMSLMGIRALNEIVNERHVLSLENIVEQLDHSIVNSLKQKQGRGDVFINDGMDISICKWNDESKILEFLGTKRPLYYFRNGEFNEIKGCHHSIGGYMEEKKVFVKHSVQLQAGDSFYLFTDGYADQFGGSAGQKITSKKFKKILQNMQGLSMAEQEEFLLNFFHTWKSQNEQVDDILIVGIKV